MWSSPSQSPYKPESSGTLVVSHQFMKILTMSCCRNNKNSPHSPWGWLIIYLHRRSERCPLSIARGHSGHCSTHWSDDGHKWSGGSDGRWGTDSGAVSLWSQSGTAGLEREGSFCNVVLGKCIRFLYDTVTVLLCLATVSVQSQRFPH